MQDVFAGMLLQAYQFFHHETFSLLTQSNVRKDVNCEPSPRTIFEKNMDILDQTNEFEGCGQNIPTNQPKLKQVTTSGTKKKSSLSTKSEEILPFTV